VTLAQIKQRVFYGWYIAGAGAGTNFIVLGITFFGFGVFMEEFRLTYGWSVTAIALGYSIQMLEQGLLAPITGHILDRVGPRKMAVAGATIIALAFLLFSQATNLPVYYAACMVMALGQSIGGPNAFSLAVMRWFIHKRGRAMSVITTGNGFGYFATMILAALIAGCGFHATFVVLAVVVLVAGIPLALVIRDRPEPFGLLPDGEVASTDSHGAAAHAARTRASGGLEVREAVRTPAFYLLVLAMAAGSAAQIVWIVFQVPHLKSAGFSLGFAGIQAAAYGMAAIPLRWAVGWLGDTFGRKKAYMLAVTLEGIGLCFFAFVAPDRWWLFIPFYLTFGIGHAGWLVMIQSLPADFFGTKRFATIRGIIIALQIPVSILVPLFMGHVFDTRGNYQLAYLVIGCLTVSGALCLGLVRRPLWIQTAAQKTRGEDAG
jgi:MFS family permease